MHLDAEANAAALHKLNDAVAMVAGAIASERMERALADAAKCYVFDVARARGSTPVCRGRAHEGSRRPFDAEQHSDRQRYSPLTATSSF
jgi:hypothetical protein